MLTTTMAQLKKKRKAKQDEASKKVMTSRTPPTSIRTDRIFTRQYQRVSGIDNALSRVRYAHKRCCCHLG